MKFGHIMIPEGQELLRKLACHPLYGRLIDCYNARNADEESEHDAAINFYITSQLKKSVELTPDTSRLLFDKVEELKKVFNIEHNVRVFKSRCDAESSKENASIVHDDKNIYIDLLNNISSLFNEKEMYSVVGHELGHYIFNKYQDNSKEYLIINYINYLVRLNDENKLLRKELSVINNHQFEEILYIHSLIEQIEELVCDRFGLIASGDFVASANSFIKFSSGKEDAFHRCDPYAYLQQADELMRNEHYFSDDELICSHPLPIMRVKALKFFFDSREYFQITGKGGNRAKLEEFKHLLPKLIPIDYVVDTGELAKIDFQFNRNLFVVLGTMMIFKADKRYTDRERDHFEKILSKNESIRERVLAISNGANPEERRAMFQDLCAKIAASDDLEKFKILKKLIAAARIDRVVTIQELQEIVKLARHIHALHILDPMLREQFRISVGE